LFHFFTISVNILKLVFLHMWFITTSSFIIPLQIWKDCTKFCNNVFAFLFIGHLCRKYWGSILFNFFLVVFIMLYQLCKTDHGSRAV
jgi:hypothetical protein